MKTNVVYTCVTGNYDRLKSPRVVDPEWDYICFTNNKNITSDVWDVRYINDDSLSDVKLARKVKILYHQYVGEYDRVLWIDANYILFSTPQAFIDATNPNNLPLSLSVHEFRDCVYEEMAACQCFGKDASGRMEAQITRYRSEGLPEHVGMVETGLMYRRKDTVTAQIMEEWWDEVMNWSHRDQLSFNYVTWKHPDFLYNTFAQNIKHRYAFLMQHG